VGLLLAVGAAIAVAVRTEKGREAWAFMYDSRTEVRKVVWPTRKETTQTTLIVMAVVVVVALLMWLLDTILGALVRLLLGQGG
jgi:preprotein translocase subunit SecE